MNKILITGGAGFIGSSLVEKIDRKHNEVYVIDNLSPQIHGQDPFKSELYSRIKDKVHFIHASIGETKAWKELPDDISDVIHLAAETGTGQSMYQIQHYSDVNVSHTALMLEVCLQKFKQLKKVVVASSRAIYGEGKYEHPTTNEVHYPIARVDADMAKGFFEPRLENTDLISVPTDEETAKHASSVYGITKLAQEMLVLNVCDTNQIPSVALRFQNVYGPGQSLNNPYTGILSIFSKRLLKNSPINIFEDGKESRDFVYIDDVVDSILLALDSKKTKSEAYNIGNGVATSVMKVAEILKQLYKSESKISVSGNYRLGDIRHNRADISKAKRDLGYEPKFDFETGINHFTKWVLTQEIENDAYEHSLSELKEKGLLKG